MSITLTFNTHKVWTLVKRKEDLSKVLAECRTGEMGPKDWKKWCDGKPRQTASEYYQAKIGETEEEIRHESLMCLGKPLDTAFVVLATEADAADIVEFEEVPDLLEGVPPSDFRYNFILYRNSRNFLPKLRKFAKKTQSFANLEFEHCGINHF